MLDMTRTRIERTFEEAVYSMDQVLEAGLALTTVLEAATGSTQVVQKLRRSNATNNSNFVGFSWGNYLGVATTMPLTTVVTAGPNVGGVSAVPLPQPATGAADLLVIAGANYGAATGMTNVANNAAVTANTDYALSGDGSTIYVDGALAGQQIFVAQRWTPSANYMRLIYGDMYLPTASAQFNRVGCVNRGLIYTNAYDTSIDWSVAVDLATANVVRAGANGRVTLNSNGAICAGVTVLSVPSITDPWLGLRINI